MGEFSATKVILPLVFMRADNTHKSQSFVTFSSHNTKKELHVCKEFLKTKVSVAASSHIAPSAHIPKRQYCFKVQTIS